MKKNRLIGLSAAALAGVFLVQGCKLVKDIDYKVTPNPVEMHGDSITLNINGKFQTKGLHKRAVVEVTPVIIGSDGTEKAFKTETFKGTKAAGNGKTIGREGGSFSYTSKIPYSSELEVAEIKVKILPKKGTKEKALIVTDKIADGTVITPLLLQNDDKVIFAKDKFQRVTSHTAEVVIHYQKDRSEVLGKEVNKKEYKDFVNWLKGATANPRIDLKGITIPAYASPEGELSFNNELANERAKSAYETIVKEFKKLKHEKGSEASFYTQQGKGEDWEGFKALMEKSSIADKELILRVLTMYNDLSKREQEIRNMAKTYKEIEETILPQLRRSVVVLSYDLTGKTDAELVEVSKSKPDSLTIEEILFTATLTNDLNEKLRLYREAARVYPQDWRGANNVGSVLYLQGKLNDAQAEFEKAAGIAPAEPIVKNNLAAIARIKGDRAKAEKLLSEATGAGPEVEYNKGIINIQKGRYNDAVGQMDKFETFNLGLAEFLNGNSGKAKSTLNASPEADAAVAHYLRAVIEARDHQLVQVVKHLSAAFEKDPSLKAKAAKDREFLKFADKAEFQNLVK